MYYTVSLNTVRTTPSGDTMKAWVKNVNAHGGGDCPEYAMDGLIKGKQYEIGV